MTGIRTQIKDIYKSPGKFGGEIITVAGWARSLRAGASVGFVELNDGSFFKNLQVVFESQKIPGDYSLISSQNIGAGFVITGELILTPQSKQPFELNAAEIKIEGTSTPDYPLQKKRHSPEFLREIAHLRPRTNLYSAIFRIRSLASFAVHKFFNEKNFIYVHTPIITTSDCEGAGNMFRVITDGETKKERENFFGKEAFLTVSGQTNAECFAMAFANVYTFGPTFRAEKSNTQKHAAEFWMIEPEIAFADLDDDINLMEECLVFITDYILTNCKEELEFLNQFIDNSLLERLNKTANQKFSRITYTKAVGILEEAVNSGVKFEYPVKWGMDIQTEHEKYLTDKIFNGPVFVTDYPEEIKAFYMRQNDGDDDKINKTVASVDLLVPGIGELIGGSQREERHDRLIDAIKNKGLKEEDYRWYLELRKYGGTKHAGFGIGFERLVMYLTGVSNIRDVCAFPRTSGNAGF
ncbi:MAG: asparagine--tRNA ligase [Oscillospiraceae bacterium]|nr:asparagine--tRNA ligase [Oscillospiraceae bacterium]